MAKSARDVPPEKSAKGKKTESKIMSIEEALLRLQELVGQLESGELSLEDSLAAFEEGIQLSRICGQHLSEAEQRVEVLLEEEGVQTRSPFTSTDEMD